jgi:hypothetical protein
MIVARYSPRFTASPELAVCVMAAVQALARRATAAVASERNLVIGVSFVVIRTLVQRPGAKVSHGRVGDVEPERRD